jgi:hypothetical protein
MALLYFLLVLNRQAEDAPTEAKKEDAPKSPSLLAKLLAPFKASDKKAKAPKSPKKEKKEEVKVRACVSDVVFLN